VSGSPRGSPRNRRANRFLFDYQCVERKVRRRSAAIPAGAANITGRGAVEPSPWRASKLLPDYNIAQAIGADGKNRANPILVTPLCQNSSGGIFIAAESIGRFWGSVMYRVPQATCDECRAEARLITSVRSFGASPGARFFECIACGRLLFEELPASASQHRKRVGHQRCR